MIYGDYDTPIMHQDLANYSMYGGIYPTSYLGGVQMRRQPDTDKLELMHKKQQEGKNTLKKALIGIGTVFALGFIPYFRKNIKKAGGIGKYLKNIWNNITAKPAPKPTMWQRFKNLFKFKKKP